MTRLRLTLIAALPLLVLGSVLAQDKEQTGAVNLEKLKATIDRLERPANLELVDKELKEAELRDAITSLERLGNLKFQGDLKALPTGKPLPLFAKEQPFGVVLQRVLDPHGWTYSVRPDGELLLQPKGKPFPNEGIDVFESVFDADVEFLRGPLAGKKLHMANMVDPKQSVARARSFFHVEPNADYKRSFALPEFFALPASVRRSDFPVIPNGFVGAGDETVYLQITALDAKSPDGKFRILAGQPLKAQFPELFKPAFGMVVSDVKSGFPARSFFVPYAVIVTPMGNLVSNAPGFEAPIHASRSLTELPPYGVDYIDKGDQMLVSADNLAGPPVAKLTNLKHAVNRAPE